MTSGRAKSRKGTKVVPRPGGDVELRRAVLVDTLDVARAQVREPEPASRVRDDDLPRVVVPREDQVERLRDAPRRFPGSGRGGCGDPRPRRRASSGAAVRAAYDCAVDADDLDAPPAQLDLDGLVAEERHVLERADRVRVDALRERVATVREVVVAEDDVRGPSSASRRSSSASPIGATRDRR